MVRKGRKAKRVTKDKVIRQMGHNDLPASVGLVKEVRSEILSETRSIRHDMSAMENRLTAKIHGLEGKMGGFDGRMGAFQGRMDAFEGRMDGLDSKIDQVLSEVHGTRVLIEEQRSENPTLSMSGLTREQRPGQT